MAPINAPKLLGKINVSPANPKPGEPVLIQACDPNGQPYPEDSDVRILIQGVQTPTRYFQFPAAGRRTLSVHAIKGDIEERMEVSIDVAGSRLRFRVDLGDLTATTMPILQVNGTLGEPYLASFSIGTPKNLGPVLAKERSAIGMDPALKRAPVPAVAVATRYEWDFGDGTKLNTQSPSVSHDYFPAMKAGNIEHTFHVRCRIAHDNLTVERTLTLISAYGLCRWTGTIVPHVTGDIYAKHDGVGYSASMIVSNIEKQAIVLNEMAWTAQDRGTGSMPYPNFVAMKTPVTINPQSSAGLGVYILMTELERASRQGPNVPGFTLYYKGTAADGTKVRFSRVFCVSMADSHKGYSTSTADAWEQALELNQAKIWNEVSAAAAHVKGVKLERKPVFDVATKTVGIPLEGIAYDSVALAAVSDAVHAGMMQIRTVLSATDNVIRTAQPTRLRARGRVFRDLPPAAPVPPTPGPVQEGQICDPANISDADAALADAQQLVCQLTDVTQTADIPSSFQNAQKGDVILSPGSDSAGEIIAPLLRAMTPPQYHSHSGIMTDNYFEITHCTAVPERLANYPRGIEGTLGVQPPILQYAWPGSITQSVDAAISGELWTDPADSSGKQYRIGGFNPQPIGFSAPNFMLVPPLVLKPLPENEQFARPLLRKVADTARSKGARVDSNGRLLHKGGAYYCFYCYTKPEISAGFTDPAGADAGWAEGSIPAVCSSFVWLCMKENNVPLVTPKQYAMPTDLSPASITTGAEVGAQTLDGLFYYTQNERQQGASVLKQSLFNEFTEREGWFRYWPKLASDVARAVADQFLNEFAFGNPNLLGSEAWKNATDANALSPDNMLWWNEPYFGYAEPLQYLPQHSEEYTVSRWTKVISRGQISGTVTLNSKAVSGVIVKVYDGKTATSDSRGHYELKDVPVGKYQLRASVYQDQIEYNNGLIGQPIELTAAHPTIIADIKLQTLPDAFRRVDILFQWKCDHGDCNPFNHHGWVSAGPNQISVPVGPGKLTNSGSYSYDYGGGSYFRIDYLLTAELNPTDLSVTVTIVGTMTNAGDNSPITSNEVSFVVPRDGQNTWHLNVEHSQIGYHNGPSDFWGTATNNRAWS